MRDPSADPVSSPTSTRSDDVVRIASKSRYQPTNVSFFEHLSRSVSWIIILVLVVVGIGIYMLVDQYGLERVAFVTGAAIIVFGLTTAAFGMILSSKKHPWLSSIVAPLAAAMFAVVFWSRLLVSPSVAGFIARLDKTYLNAISVVITILSISITVWLGKKFLRSFF